MPSSELVKTSRRQLRSDVCDGVVLTVMASCGASARGPVSPKPGKIIISSTERSHPRHYRNRDRINRSVPAASLQWGDLWSPAGGVCPRRADVLAYRNGTRALPAIFGTCRFPLILSHINMRRLVHAM